MPTIMKRLFLDFDHTLYDTGTLMVSVRQDMQNLGANRKEIERVQRQLDAEGYSFERHLALLGFPPKLIASRVRTYRQWLMNGDRFLFPGVAEGMAHVSKIAECRLLTFGFPPHQRRKVRGVASLRGLFTAQHYVWRDKTKGDVVNGYRDSMDTYFLDDTPSRLEEVSHRAPGTTCIRMEWPRKKRGPYPGDEKTWDVVHSFEAFIRIVQGHV